MEIQPALLKQAGDDYRAYFPGATEQLVEEALKKIFTDQVYRIHDPDKEESWVKFTLRMIQKELKSHHKDRNLTQIKHAIRVMSRCHITVHQNGKEVYSGSILSDLVTINRADYVEGSDTHHIARLPIFISHGINRREYRQFNYGRFMECNEQLTRWPYKRLVHRYRQASLIDPYHFMYSDVRQASALLQQGRPSRNREKMISALKELKARAVLDRYTVGEYKEGRRIIDVKYTIYATTKFMMDQKAASKRATENEAKRLK